MPDAPHSLADHSMGALASHGHARGEFDHEHDSGFEASDSKSLESVSFISIGVDIGSSSTQIVFTRLEMRGPGEHRSLRRQAKSRETLYLSPIVMTPFLDDGTLDEARLRGTLARSFEAAGLTPDDVETGAVILTGEAAKRGNAEAIAHLAAGDAGDLVCAAAGARMEAMLAARGSGAVEASRGRGGMRILNIDIGGATTKLALIDDGRIIATSALGIGGRLAATGRDGRLARWDRRVEVFARRAGVTPADDGVISTDEMARIASAMADALIAALAARPMAPDTAELFILDPLGDFGHIDGVMFSGGVGEYVYRRESRGFGDLGLPLGEALARRMDAGALPWQVLPAGECIRATVFGASEHTLQLSGQTIHISNHAALLPRRNLPVLHPGFDFSRGIDPGSLTAAILACRAVFGFDDPSAEFALAFAWRGSPEYPRLRALAEGIAGGMADRIARAAPLYIMLEGDAAMSLGEMLRRELKIASEVLVIDGIVLRHFDYVDIGRLRLPSNSVPVTIKSLLFGERRQAGRSCGDAVTE